jgi:hypothetical protein
MRLPFFGKCPGGLGAQGAADVREDVVDLVANHGQDDDDNDGDEDEDQGVLDHSLALLLLFELGLANHEPTKVLVKVAQHIGFFTSL